MKIALEIGTFTHTETGIYRYSTNLAKSLKQVEPTLQLTPVTAREMPGMAPTNPKLFQEIFGSEEIVFHYEVSKRFGPRLSTQLIRRSHYFHRAYYRHKLKQKTFRGKKFTAPSLLSKLKREFHRSLSIVIDQCRNLSYQSIRLTTVPAGTDVLHSFYDPLPEDPGCLHSHLTCQTVHDIIPLLFEQSHFKGFPAIIDSARRVDLIITVSESSKRDLLTLGGFHENRIEVVPLAAASIFQPAHASAVAAIREKTSIPEGIPYFLSVSTLEPRKNFPFLLRAFQKLITSPDTAPCKLVLTGRIGWGPDVQKEISSLLEDLKDHVHYTGFLCDQELAALYTGAQAFLFPSLYEGFGLPPLESMACGTPVISSNTTSMPEVIGDSGILLPPTDERAWIAAMQQSLLRSPQENEQASLAALARASHFSWQETARLTLAAYHKALARKNSHRL